MRTETVIVALAALLLVGGVGVAVAADYSISIDGSTDVPDRTLTIDGSEYTITGIAQHESGEQVSVTVDAPDESYSVYLYNSDLEIVETRSMDGSGSTTLSTDCSECDPGTYLVAAYDGDIRAVYPLVISGYDVSIDAPDSGESGSSVDVTVTAEETELSTQPHAIEVVLANDDESVRETLSAESSDVYTGSISLDGLDADTYQIYGVALGEEEIDGGENEILALSNAQSFEVTESSNGDDGDSDAGSGGGEGASPPADSTETATETPDETATETPDETATETPDETATETPEDTVTDTPTEVESDDEVITPSDPTDTEAEGVGMTALVAILSISAALIGFRYRRR